MWTQNSAADMDLPCHMSIPSSVMCLQSEESSEWSQRGSAALEGISSQSESIWVSLQNCWKNWYFWKSYSLIDFPIKSEHSLSLLTRAAGGLPPSFPPTPITLGLEQRRQLSALRGPLAGSPGPGRPPSSRLFQLIMVLLWRLFFFFFKQPGSKKATTAIFKCIRYTWSLDLGERGGECGKGGRDGVDGVTGNLSAPEASQPSALMAGFYTYQLSFLQVPILHIGKWTS